MLWRSLVEFPHEILMVVIWRWISTEEDDPVGFSRVSINVVLLGRSLLLGFCGTADI